MNTILQTQMKAAPSPSFSPIHTGLLQRKCASDECAERRKKRLTLQRSSTNHAGPSEVPPIVHDVLCSPGQPLDQATRALMEPRFGHDFSKVRVHTDEKAAESARAVNASAYTVGRNVVFGAGQYAPGREKGQKLLVHELTHVLQQRHSALGSQRSLRIGYPTDTYEFEANHLSECTMHGVGPSHKVLLSVPTIQRRSIGSDAESVPSSEASSPRPIQPGVTLPYREATELNECMKIHNDLDFCSRQVGIDLGLRTYAPAVRFVPGPVNAVLNYADQILSGENYAGNTLPVLNGTEIILVKGHGLQGEKAEKEARARAISAINGPGISVRSVPTGGVECWIDSVPTNEGSLDMTVLTNGPWNRTTTKADLAAKLGIQDCAKAGAGNATFTVIGKPSDRDIAKATKDHEDKHAAIYERVFKRYMVPWHNAMTAAYASNQRMKSSSAAACKAGIFAKIGGTTDAIATKLYYEWINGNNGFHKSPAGQELGACHGQYDPNCSRVTMEANLPGICPPPRRP